MCFELATRCSMHLWGSKNVCSAQYFVPIRKNSKMNIHWFKQCILMKRQWRFHFHSIFHSLRTASIIQITISKQWWSQCVCIIENVYIKLNNVQWNSISIVKFSAFFLFHWILCVLFARLDYKIKSCSAETTGRHYDYVVFHFFKYSCYWTILHSDTQIERIHSMPPDKGPILRPMTIEFSQLLLLALLWL